MRHSAKCKGGLQTYAYAGNNPVNWIDPFGLEYFPFDHYRDSNIAKNLSILDEIKNKKKQINDVVKQNTIEALNPIVDTAAQTAAKQLTDKLIGKTLGMLLGVFNSLASILDPFAKPLNEKENYFLKNYFLKQNKIINKNKKLQCF